MQAIEKQTHFMYNNKLIAFKLAPVSPVQTPNFFPQPNLLKLQNIIVRVHFFQGTFLHEFSPHLGNANNTTNKEV